MEHPPSPSALAGRLLIRPLSFSCRSPRLLLSSSSCYIFLFFLSLFCVFFFWASCKHKARLCDANSPSCRQIFTVSQIVNGFSLWTEKLGQRPVTFNCWSGKKRSRRPRQLGRKHFIIEVDHLLCNCNGHLFNLSK